MTTYTTPNLIEQLTRRIEALETRIDQQDEIIEALQVKRSSSNSEHAKQKEIILDLFKGLPRGFKMTVPTIVENLPDGTDLTSGLVGNRIGTLVNEGRLKRHQEGTEHPKFSMLP